MIRDPSAVACVSLVISWLDVFVPAHKISVTALEISWQMEGIVEDACHKGSQILHQISHGH